MSKSTRTVLCAFRRFMAEARFEYRMSVADAWGVYRKICRQQGREYAREQLLANYAS